MHPSFAIYWVLIVFIEAEGLAVVDSAPVDQ
jgi:hypothetical protein